MIRDYDVTVMEIGFLFVFVFLSLFLRLFIYHSFRLANMAPLGLFPRDDVTNPLTWHWVEDGNSWYPWDDVAAANTLSGDVGHLAAHDSDSYGLIPFNWSEWDKTMACQIENSNSTGTF